MLAHKLVETHALDQGQDIFIPAPRDFRCESGELLPDAQLRLRHYGAAGAPLVIVSGGISSGRMLHEWWGDQVARGAAIDLSRYGALGFDFSPLADQRVRISPRDQARLLVHALDALGAPRVEAWVGASYGAMVGFAFAAEAPARLKRLCAISAAERPAALARGWRGVQRRIVEFALEQNEPARGLSLARQLAMITYRSGEELQTRFPGGVDAEGLSEVDRYLIARGDAYIETMAPRRWLSLSESIDRCAIEAAHIQTPVTLAACPADQIAPLADIESLARRLPRLQSLNLVASVYGHDAFLKEAAQIRAVIRACLETPDV
ncbi:MAG: alpha/beta fold hydrolase [Phycisphaerales bacterium]|nr:alpha/beta fold hydrolase [Hyphomonadaceae bacterium]